MAHARHIIAWQCLAARSWSSRDWLSRVQQQPFFLFLHLFEPHSPYEPVEPFKSRYANDPSDGEIATADAILGRFLAQLDRRGLYDRSLIVFFGDHGEGLDEHAEHGVLQSMTVTSSTSAARTANSDSRTGAIRKPNDRS